MSQDKMSTKGNKLSVVLSSLAIIISIVAVGMQIPAVSGKFLQSNVQSGVLQDDFLYQEIEKGIERYIKESQEPKVIGVKEDDHLRGDKSAAITIIEYSDYECPYCAEFHGVVKELVEKNEGKVNWVYRHFPLDFHEPMASLEANAAECAGDVGGEELFWEYSDALYASEYKSDTKEDLVALAHELGIDEDKFGTCLDSNKYNSEVIAEKQEALDAKINGTPGNIIMNNETGDYQIIPGALPYEQMQQIIDQMM